MKQAVAVYRVSTGKQAVKGVSLETQRDHVRRYASENGYAIVEEVSIAESGLKAFSRKAIRLIHKAFEKHPLAKQLLVYRLNRFARNPLDYLHLRDVLGVEIVSIQEGGAQTPSEEFMQLVMFGVGEYESKKQGSIISDNMLHRVQKGFYPGKAPRGYMELPRRDGDPPKKGIHPEHGPHVREAFRRYSEGKTSLKEVAMQLANAGIGRKNGLPLREPAVMNMLLNPFYVGKIRYKGIVYDGNHEALVRPSVWRKVQAVVEARRHDVGEKGSKEFLLRGLLWCEACGRRLTAEEAKGGRYRYYRCQSSTLDVACDARYIRCSELDDEVEALLQVIQPDPTFADELASNVDAMVAEQRDERLAAVGRLAKQEDAIDEKRARLLELAATNALPVEDVAKALSRTDADRELLAAERAALGEDVSARAKSLKALLRRRDVVALYRLAETVPEKKRILARIFDGFTIREGHIVDVKVNAPFSLLLPQRHASRSTSLQKRVVAYLAGTDESMSLTTDSFVR